MSLIESGSLIDFKIIQSLKDTSKGFNLIDENDMSK
jgi:hypothetical protein